MARLAPGWAPGAADATDASTVVVAEAVLRLLAAAGERCGCLLALEDLQWADPETIDVVEYVADNVAEEPLVCVATVRGDEPTDAVRRLNRLVTRRAATAITLHRLDAASVRAMAAACLGPAERDGRLIGSNFVTGWGSVGFFGPLSVRPELWDQGIASQLMPATVAALDGWDTRHGGLFTFPHSAKHLGLYQKFGFRQAKPRRSSRHAARGLMSHCRSLQYTTTGRPRSRTAALASSSSFSGMLTAPAMGAHLYSGFGSTSTT